MNGASAEERLRLEREIRRLRHELDQAVRSLPQLRQMVEHSADLLILAGPGGTILESNSRLAQVLAVPQAELYGEPLQRWLANPGQRQVLEERLSALAPGEFLRMELDLQPPAGEALPMELEAHRLQTAVQEAPRWMLSLRDLSDRRRLETSEAARQVQTALIASLRSSEARYQELVDQLADGIAQIDAAGTFLFCNPAMHRLLDMPEGELLGRRLQEFLPDLDQPFFAQILADVLRGQARRCELRLQPTEGDARLVELELNPRRDGVGERACGAVASLLLRDVTDLNRALTELTDLAFHDALTGLSNAEASRRELERRLEEPAPPPWLVLWLDLDGFRRVNHSFGREAGDALLQAVAEGLRSCQAPLDLLARLGGDEFLLVRALAGPADDPVALRLQAEAALAQLRACLSALELGQEGLPMALSFSAGYSLAPLHGTQAEVLLQAAATALSRAREVAPGTALLYQQGFTTSLRREMDLESRLHQALNEGGLNLVYQPQLDAAGRLIGAEALLRWHDPLRGAIPPARFVPMAERSGLIHPLGQWVLEQACRQQRLWLDAGLRPPRLAVNLSPRQFELTVPPLIDQVAALLERHRLPPSLLELEITESCILPMVGAIAQVQQLADMGVQLALDDFGTGYSSLSALNRLAIHKLKIDRSFVEHLETSESARTIVRTALAMGRGLGLETLAEGVETARQLEVLELLGCDAYQGYWFSRPLEAGAFAALLAQQPDVHREDGSSSPAHHAS